ncbi:MAG: hypothetical protein NVS4B12_20590 [Ktedonobacteraceae bacterium]
MTDTSIFSLVLGVLGPIGIMALLAFTCMILYFYRGGRMGSFRWHLRNLRLKQLSAVACMFFFAMAASYGIIHEAWAVLYVIFAFKTGTWWLRCAVSQRT